MKTDDLVPRILRSEIDIEVRDQFKRNWKGGEGSVKIFEITQASTNLTVFLSVPFNVNNYSAQRP